MSLDALEQISTIVSAAVAVVGLPLILLQLRVARQQEVDAIRLSGSQVLLAVDSILTSYKEINALLRPGGAWCASEERPTDAEMPLVEPYLGAFERLWIAYSIGQIDINTIEHLYGYRIQNIWANPRLVKEKLQHPIRRQKWWMFLALTCALEEVMRIPEHTDSWRPPQWVAWRQKPKRGHYK